MGFVLQDLHCVCRIIKWKYVALLVVKHNFESLFFHDHKIAYIRYEVISYSEVVQYFHLSFIS